MTRVAHFSLLFSSWILSNAFVEAQLVSSSLDSHVDVLDLGYRFNPVKPAYWTGLPHHRRTPFALSPDGQSGYLAYLDSSETDVHIQKINPATFAAVGTPITVTGGKEAGGLVAQNDGFALLTNIPVTGVDSAPPNNTPVPVIVRYINGAESWRTWLGGPGVHTADGLAMSPDLNGDLVYSEAAGLYGAYFVVTEYEGWAAGHFGDSIEYIDDKGTLQNIKGASSSWGCSHNTGIAFEAADQPPFASICAEDHGSIWLNTATRSMNGQKIAGENVTNGASGEPMGGMSGSYSSLANFPGSTAYIFAWATRGCVNLTPDSWMGNGFTQCSPRTLNHNVAISLMTDKQTMAGKQAISQVGAASGDDQLNLVTTGSIDHSNVHVATFDGSTALVTWEEIATPSCTDVAMGCSGTFSGAYYLAVDKTGAKVGEPISSNNVYVSGDIVNMGTKLCWPYVNMAWSLNKPQGWGATPSTVTKMSFACLSNGGTGANGTSTDGSASANNNTRSTSSGVANPTENTKTTTSVTVAGSASSVVPDLGTSLSLFTDLSTAVAPAVTGIGSSTDINIPSQSSAKSVLAGSDTSATPTVTAVATAADPNQSSTSSDSGSAGLPSGGDQDTTDLMQRLLKLLQEMVSQMQTQGRKVRRHARDLIM